ncbi:MAG: DUF521 domain-containing protein [Actinobacteria bacterium]|nr:DUF521 domain-containing protein [Actinomycetota bacterium]
MKLTDAEAHWLSGGEGKAQQLAMRLIVAAAEASGALELVPIDFAHINSCHYSGKLSLDFAEFLLAEGAQLSVPTHTNASLIDRATPGLRPDSDFPEEVAGAHRLMDIYEQLGCTPMWSCAPYQQTDGRPALGQQIAGSESNAVGFFNSVLGARTNKYGDLLDISAAIIGRVPFVGLHTDEGRLATHLFEIRLPDELLIDPRLPHVLGLILGREANTAVPVIMGLPAAEEDDLKAIAAAAATAGAVEMFHVVGITPEAPTLDDATGGRGPSRTTVVDSQLVASMLASLSTCTAESVSAVCLGTPHFSVAEFSELVGTLGEAHTHPSVTVIVTTSRSVWAEVQLRGWDMLLGAAGIQVVLDTCTYYLPRATGVTGTVMTNSAKWAYYAPGMLDVEVVFASLADCVASAIAAEIRLSDEVSA